MPIRKMTIDDIPQVLAIQQDLQFQNWNAKQIQSEINAIYSLCIVYESESTSKSNGAILGYAMFNILGHEFELLSIATARSAQKKGIGAQILNEGLSKMDKKNGDTCFLEVREGNVIARQFYENQGFFLYGTRKKYYADGENACLYSTNKKLQS